MKQVAAALVKAQRQFGSALKTSNNPHFKSRYADLATCVDAVLDALNSAGIALVQQTHECADGVIVETVFIHESGETLSAGKLHVPAGKHDPQGYGSALTYARRYSLMAACGIAPEDDDGNAASQPKRTPAPAPAAEVDKLSADDVADIEALAAKAGKDLTTVLNFYKVTALADIPADQYQRIVRSMSKKEATA